ncbi:MAG: mannose-6-phosphate isomerase, class I [Actinomycetota bacterium]|nr:mannose-6-phosphate isomerase, class I [Actinomycetota bacterium]
MLVVRGAVKEYDWGKVDGLVAWTGEATGRPQAELWFGAHPGGPSPLIDGSGVPTGELLADHFDVDNIPILVKLLAAARPLSVQVHPAAATARAMWQAQLDGSGRTVLTDPFEKTEMLVALEPFEALAGWRAPEQAAAILAMLPGCAAGAEAAAAGATDHAITDLLAVPDAGAAVSALPGAVAGAGIAGPEAAAYARVAALFPHDPGALLTALLNYVALAPGEGIFVPAGVPHSYLSGTGLEVMTSSDNVLRLGLTAKDVFVEEALAALAPDRVPVLASAPSGAPIAPRGAPFSATMLRSGSLEIESGQYRIVLLIEGSARVSTSLADVELRMGTAAVLAAPDPSAHVTVDGLAAVVTAPVAPFVGKAA